MIQDVLVTIIDSLLENATIQGDVGSRVFPDERSASADPTLPAIVVFAQRTGGIRGGEAVDVTSFITVYSKKGRANANIIIDHVRTALEGMRLSRQVADHKTCSGSLIQLGEVEANYDTELEKWIAESSWQGRFIRRG